MNTNDRQTHPAAAVSALYEQALALQQKWGVPNTCLQGVHQRMPTGTARLPAVASRSCMHTCIDAGVGEPTGQETARPGQLMQSIV